METKEIKVLEKKVMPLVAAAQSQMVESDADMTTATKVLSELGRYFDSVVEAREKITAPLNASLKATRDMFNPIEKPAKAAIDELRGRISDYQTEQMRIAEEEEAKIAARVKPGKGNLSADVAMDKIAEIEKPAESIHTDAGALNFRKDPVLEIVDEALIPKEYWVVDTARLFADLKDGKEVPGAKVGFKMTPINRRK